MGFACGIIGLPNVGKSTLFNALSAETASRAENFPFCTIEPNTAQVSVPDPLLQQIGELAQSARILEARLRIEDIAGLVRGASRGEGLGNRFLGHVRQVDAIVHVLRCFGGEGIVHVEGGADPVRDAEIVETELMLADLEQLTRQLARLEKQARGKDPEALRLMPACELGLACLERGEPARQAPVPDEHRAAFAQLGLLSAKPVLFVLNIGEAPDGADLVLLDQAREHARAAGAQSVTLCATLEAEISRLKDPEERAQFLALSGLEQAGLVRLADQGYRLLDLLTFYTAGPKEARAWTVPRGARASRAAGRIHSDIERGFIAAEIIAGTDYLACQGEQGAKSTGRMRLEGRDYVMQQGDVAHFRFNV